MRKDFKYAQRHQAAFGRPKNPGAASGHLKILYNYILNNSKILLDTVWISYSNSDEQKIIEKVYFFCCIGKMSSFSRSISGDKLIQAYSRLFSSVLAAHAVGRVVGRKSCHNVSEITT